MRSTLVLLSIALSAGTLVAACQKKSGSELTCKVNGVCFVCVDEKAQAKCKVDPSTARCKYAEPDHCK